MTAQNDSADNGGPSALVNAKRQGPASLIDAEPAGIFVHPAAGTNSRNRSYDQLYQLLVDAGKSHEYADKFARSFAEKRSVGRFPPS